MAKFNEVYKEKKINFKLIFSKTSVS